MVSSICLFILDWRWPLQFVTLFDLTVEEDQLSAIEDSSEDQSFFNVSQRRKSIRKPRKRKSQVIPFQSDDNGFVYSNEPVVNGKTSMASGSAVQMHTIALPDSTA